MRPIKKEAPSTKINIVPHLLTVCPLAGPHHHQGGWREEKLR